VRILVDPEGSIWERGGPRRSGMFKGAPENFWGIFTYVRAYHCNHGWHSCWGILLGGEVHDHELASNASK
jgi:hypothetical protein